MRQCLERFLRVVLERADDLVVEYFAQLTGEVKRRKFTRGHAYFEWHATRPRVEALDCRVYALAAVRIAQQHFGLRLVREIETPAPVKTEPKQTYIQRPGAGYLKR